MRVNTTLIAVSRRTVTAMKTLAVHLVAIAGRQAARRKAISAFTKSGPGGNRKLTLSCHHPPVAALKVAPAGPARAAANGVGVGVDEVA